MKFNRESLESSLEPRKPDKVVQVGLLFPSKITSMIYEVEISRYSREYMNQVCNKRKIDIFVRINSSKHQQKIRNDI